MQGVRVARMNTPGAFSGMGLAIQSRTGQRDNGEARTVYGCRCKRSKCLKKYCECFGAGLECGDNCICQDCLNVSK